jgi:NADH-quinone oxidoreductase subunit D
MNYISPIANEVSWLAAVEKLLGVELTPAVQVPADDLRRAGADQRPPAVRRGRGPRPRRALTRFLYAFNSAETIYNIFEAASGQRFHPATPRRRAVHDIGPGGRRTDPRRSSSRSRRPTRDCPAAEPQQHLHRPDQGRRRPVEGGRDQLPVAGPVARASGVVRDLRKDEPYLAYPTCRRVQGGVRAPAATATPRTSSAWARWSESSRSSRGGGEHPGRAGRTST